jgi:hypothetical protein
VKHAEFCTAKGVLHDYDCATATQMITWRDESAKLRAENERLKDRALQFEVDRANLRLVLRELLDAVDAWDGEIPGPEGERVDRATGAASKLLAGQSEGDP